MIWVFNETNGSGLWSSNTVTNADAMIAKLNTNYSSLQAPNLVVTGVANIQNSKISFVRKGFQSIDNSTCFHSYSAARAAYYDPDAINIYFVEDTGTPTGVPYPYPNNSFPYNTDLNFTDIANLQGWNLDHELCHALGLEHTWLVPAWSLNGGAFINTNENCCPTLVPNDYHQELYQNLGQYTTGDEWALIGDCNVLGPLHSNNIMGYNFNCRRYLSPLQLALMHHNLRTNFTHVLTTNSYNNHFVRNSSLDYVVQNGNGGETWTENRYFKGNITVKSGNKLEILCKVGMAKGTSIIVERGAQLVIGAGGELTNISCQKWDGVFVQGSSNLPQVVNGTSGYAANQGVVRVINGGKISNAENGIRNYSTYANGQIDWNSRGGVIVGNGGVFENNVRDVEFISYHNALGNDYSSFTNCQFLTSKTGFTSFAHVTMWDTKGVQFIGCKFDYTASNTSTSGNGILSMDADFYVDKQGSTKTTFRRMRRGVYVLNSNPLKRAFVKNTVFTENGLDGAYFRNMNFFSFEKNEVTPLTMPLSNGLYLHTCQNYKVKLNEFHENYNGGNFANGLYAYNSQGGAHEIYKNKFYDLHIGVNVMDKNSSNSQSFDDGLKINCNDFSTSANGFDVALTKTLHLNPPTVMREQGNIDLNNSDAKLVVRNIYGAICNNQENQWYIDASSGWKIVDHGSNSNSNTKPLPQPSCSGYLVNVVDKGFPLNYSADCKDYPESSGGVFSDMAEAYDNLNTYLADRISINNNNDQYFEIQATLASKMGFLLNDTTAGSGDSVVALLQNYGDYIADSDLQLVFAQMRNSNYGEAQAAINNLDSTRTDWATLLDFMLDMEQDSMKYYRLFVDTNAVNFLEGYANEAGRDGQFVAQNILHFILGMEFEEPRTYLETGGGEKRRGETSKNKNDITRESGTVLFPNPGSNNFQIVSDLKIHGTLIVSDVLGRKVILKAIEDSDKIQFSLEGYGNGIYLVAIRDKQANLIFKEKLIKQN